jgi:hypothetical protein
MQNMFKDTLKQACLDLAADVRSLEKLLQADIPDRVAAQALLQLDKMRGALGKLLAKARPAGDGEAPLFDGGGQS